MSRKINLIIFLCFILCEVYAQYVPDVLGDGYLRRTFQMPDDYEGKDSLHTGQEASTG